MTEKIKELIAKIEKAPDFGYDDEAVELSTELAKLGKKWGWVGECCNYKIEIYDIE